MSTAFWLSDHLEALAKLDAQGKLPHALLVYGQEGAGKAELLEHFMGVLMCTQPRSAIEACGECSNCQLIRSGTHPDIRMLAVGEKTIKIADVRGLQDFVHQSSHQSQRRIILIPSVERMTTAAANALLKMLEEPPEKTLFLLSTGKPHRLLPTIRSRCQQYLLGPPEAQRVKAWLLESGYAEEAVESSLCLAAGSPLKAKMLIDGQGLEDALSIQQTLIALEAGQIGPMDAAKRLESFELEFVLEMLFTSVSQAWRDAIGWDRKADNSQGIAFKSFSNPLNVKGIIQFSNILMHKLRGFQSGITLNNRLVLDELMIEFLSQTRA